MQCQIKTSRIMKQRILTIVAMLLFTATAVVAQSSYTDDPVYQQHYRRYQKVNRTRQSAGFPRLSVPQRPQQVQYTTPVQTVTYQQTPQLVVQQDPSMTMQIQDLQESINMLNKKLNDSQLSKKERRTPGDYLVRSGRMQWNAIATGLIGSTATAGLFYYAGRDDCKDPKAFRNIAIGVGATAGLLTILFATSAINCKIKAGKKLNVTANGLAYNF